MGGPRPGENDHNSTSCLYSTLSSISSACLDVIIQLGASSCEKPESTRQTRKLVGQRVRTNSYSFQMSIHYFTLKSWWWPFLAISLETISWEIRVPNSNLISERFINSMRKRDGILQCQRTKQNLFSPGVIRGGKLNALILKHISSSMLQLSLMYNLKTDLYSDLCHKSCTFYPCSAKGPKRIKKKNSSY